MLHPSVEDVDTIDTGFHGFEEASFPGYVVRFIGGAIFLAGMFVMAYNVYMTARGQTREEAHAPATPLVDEPDTAPATGG